MVEKTRPNWRRNSETLKDELRTENDEVLRKLLLPCCGVNISVSVTFQSFVLRHLVIASDRNIKKLQGSESSIGVILTPWIVCRQNCKHKSRNGQENNTNLLKRVNQWPPFSQRIQILGGELRESQKLPTGGAMKAFYQPFATGLEHGTQTNIKSWLG